jgi:hypothetical protein
LLDLVKEKEEKALSKYRRSKQLEFLYRVKHEQSLNDPSPRFDSSRHHKSTQQLEEQSSQKLAPTPVSVLDPYTGKKVKVLHRYNSQKCFSLL